MEPIKLKPRRKTVMMDAPVTGICDWCQKPFPVGTRIIYCPEDKTTYHNACPELGYLSNPNP